jgi:DNA-binding transcriptional regulator YiaG
MERPAMKEKAKFYIENRPFLPEPFHLKVVGLPNIYLLNGVTIENDPNYGELVTVENMDGLHRAIGLHIIEKEEDLTGAEIRFLRKEMDLTQVELGEKLSVTGQTIANYEKEKSQDGPADAAIRLLYLIHILPPDSQTRLLKQLLALNKTRERKLPDVPRRRLVGAWHERECAVPC